MVSIIIPVYNGEEYIDRCLSSVVNQSYVDIDIIVIDDGSTDDTKKLLLKWINKDKRIRLISKKNEGVSAARNIGIEMSKGEYISFLDVDDEYDNNYIFSCLNEFSNKDIDIVSCNYYSIENDNICLGVINLVDENDDYHREILKNSGILGFVFNKVYRKEILMGIKFNTSIHIYEDLVFNMEIALRKPKFSYISKPLYKYYQTPTSVMHTKLKVDESHFYAYIKIIDMLFLLRDFKLVKDRMYYFIWDYNSYLTENNKNVIACSDIKNTYDMCKYMLLNSKSIKIRFKIIMQEFFPNLFFYLNRIKHR